VGGRIRQEPEDFFVEEIPEELPAGAGEHLYVWAEKCGIPTLEAAGILARALDVPEMEVGYAGMKDARAVSLQWFSVLLPGKAAERKLAAAGDQIGRGLRVLKAKRGRSRLRRGALRGNQFEIRVRGVAPGSADRAREAMGILLERGLPNAFGEQRFGVRGNSAEVGRALALGDWDRAAARLLGASAHGPAPEGFESDRDSEAGRAAEAALKFDAGDFAGARRLYPENWRTERRVLAALAAGEPPRKALRRIPRREAMIFGAAFQAAVFNACLAQRLAAGAHGRLLAGDVVADREGRIRRIGDPEKEAGALARFEISPAGPLIGERIMEARGEPGEIEAAARRMFGLAPGDAERGLSRMGLKGDRRAYRVRIEDAGAEEEGSDLLMRFTLPPGAYATEVLREVMKVEPPAGARYYLEKSEATEGIPNINGGET
jgi:tRNA pseudouridine13 synthase